MPVLVTSARLLSGSAPSVLRLPAASASWLLATWMVALVLVLSGVKVAVQTLGSVVLCTRGPRVPPETWMSSRVKSALSSLRVKVMVDSWPGASLEALLVMRTAGGVVSMVKGVMSTWVVTPLVVTLSTG